MGILQLNRAIAGPCQTRQSPPCMFSLEQAVTAASLCVEMQYVCFAITTRGSHQPSSDAPSCTRADSRATQLLGQPSTVASLRSICQILA